MTSESQPERRENDADIWRRELLAAGWIEESATLWRSPRGHLYRGPYGAWRELTKHRPLDEQ